MGPRGGRKFAQDHKAASAEPELGLGLPISFPVFFPFYQTESNYLTSFKAWELL